MEAQLIVPILEALAEQHVFTDPSDPQALAHLHGVLQALAEQLQATEHDAAGAALSAVRGATDLVQQMIFNEVNDLAASMESLGRTIDGLQAVLVRGVPLDQADLPTSAAAPVPATTAGATAPTPAATPPVIAATQNFKLPANVDQAILAEFLARQGSVLEEMESLLLAQEKQEDEAKLAEYRRLVHTLKGETALLGLDPICRMCHKVEDALAVKPAPALVDVLLRIKDWLGRCFDSLMGKGPWPTEMEDLLAQLQTPPADAPASSDAAPDATAPTATGPQKDGAPGGSPLQADTDLVNDFISEAREHLENADVDLLNLESEGNTVERLNGIFRSFHTIKGVAGFIGLPDIQLLAHEAETLLDRARKGQLKLAGPTVDVAFDALDMMKQLVERVATALESGSLVMFEPALPALVKRIRAACEGQVLAGGSSRPVEARAGDRLGEVLVRSGAATPEQVEQAAATQQELPPPLKPLGEILVRDQKVPARVVAEGLQAQRSSRPGGADQAGKADAPVARNTGVQVADTVKVDAARLDRLVDTIGELVIAEAMVTQAIRADHAMATQHARVLSQLEKITRELQEMATSLRMVPVRSTFQKMARLARDVAKKLDKKIDFVMIGEDTELDKTVVDRIGDPLVHMIRNAVDHGIEADPQERIALGKNPVGKVELRAYHQGGGICIQIADDGKGLDAAKLLAKAKERGLVQDGDNLSEKEIFALIFAPGFSTATQVTDVSGRGVGMDVVRRNIESLRGKVEIESRLGAGSIFTIRLPLTLAIIEGMVVGVGAQRYIVPTLSIERMLQPTQGQIKTVQGRGEMICQGDELIPLFRLHRLFKVRGQDTDPTQATTVVVECNQRKAALVVDTLLGQQQIVIKSLGESMQGIRGVAGGAIMPDGRVGLVLDVAGLVHMAQRAAA